MSKQEVQLLSTEFQSKNEFLLVKPAELPTEQVTESGLILAIKPSVIDRPSSGTVINVGSEILDINPGDFVLWPNTDGLDLKFIDGDFMLIRYKSIIGFKKATQKEPDING